MGKNSFLVFYLVIIFLSELILGQTWEQCKSLPEAMVPAAVSDNGKIYALRYNNFYRGNLTEPSSLYEYNPVTSEWTNKGKMSTVRLLFSMLLLNGKIYVVGGISNDTYQNFVTCADVEVFDIASGKWEIRASMPEPLYVMGLVSAQERIYVLGGNCRKLVNGSPIGSTSNQVYEYDPEKDIWTTKSSMIKCRSWSDGVAVNDKIYGIGGNNGNNFTGENTIEEFDISANSWIEKTTFINGFDGQCQSTVIKGKIYTLSSDITSTGTFTKALIGEYDPETGVWKENTRMLTPIMDFGKVVCNDKLYMIGGHLVSGMTFTNKAIEYDPVTNKQIYLPDISQWFNAVAEVDGNIYLIGGTDSKGNYINKVVKYDIQSNTTSVNEIKVRPDEFSLLQNYPNPFNSSTIISFQLPVSGQVELKVYDILGNEVATLINEDKPSGEYELEFDGSKFSGGVYLYVLSTGGMRLYRKMCFLK